jgi:hypothetical protein
MDSSGTRCTFSGYVQTLTLQIVLGIIKHEQGGDGAMSSTT